MKWLSTRWIPVLIVALSLMLGAAGLAVGIYAQSVTEQRDATAERALTLAEQVQAACDAGTLGPPLSQACEVAEVIVAEPIPDGPIPPVPVLVPVPEPTVVIREAADPTVVRAIAADELSRRLAGGPLTDDDLAVAVRAIQVECVASGECAGTAGADGTPGETGPPPDVATIRLAILDACATDLDCIVTEADLIGALDGCYASGACTVPPGVIAAAVAECYATGACPPPAPGEPGPPGPPGEGGPPGPPGYPESFTINLAGQVLACTDSDGDRAYECVGK